MNSTSEDRYELPIDFRFLDAFLRSSDLELPFGAFAVGVRVGPGAMIPSRPTLHVKKRKWRIQEQREQQEVDEEV